MDALSVFGPAWKHTLILLYDMSRETPFVLQNKIFCQKRMLEMSNMIDAYFHVYDRIETVAASKSKTFSDALKSSPLPGMVEGAKAYQQIARESLTTLLGPSGDIQNLAEFIANGPTACMSLLACCGNLKDMIRAHHLTAALS
jgi:hypothetical protein